jgi:hypothetical protein
VLEANDAYQRGRSIRRVGITALAIAGGALWVSWSVGSATFRYLALAGWLTLLALTLGAEVVELRCWHRLRVLTDHRTQQDDRQETTR